MSEPDLIPDHPEASDLKQEVADLRRLTNILLIALAVVSVTMTAFLGLQSLRAGKDLESSREQRMQFVEMLKRQRADIEKFTSSIAAFGQTHLDLAPILSKYGLNKAAAAAPQK